MRTFRESFYYICLIFTLLASILPCACHAEVPDGAALTAKDPRLGRKVTVVRERARIGEIFLAVEKQTGVHLVAEDRDGAAGEEVGILVRDMPLADLMTDLWSLLSYRKGEWRWVRVDDKAKQAPTYQLTRPSGARDYPAYVRVESQKYFEAVMEANVDKATATTPNSADDSYPETRAVGAREKLKIKAFASLCSASERLRFARGEAQPRDVPRSEWPPEVAAYVAEEVALAKANFDKHPEIREQFPDFKYPDPQKVTIDEYTLPGDLTPSVWLSMDGMGGYPAAGSMQTSAYWQTWLQDAWMQPGDSRTDPAREAIKVPVAVPPSAAGTPEPLPASITDRVAPAAESDSFLDSIDWRTNPVACLTKIFRLTGQPILTRLGDELESSGGPDPRNTTVAATLHDLGRRKLMFKWRNGALLAGYLGWVRAAEGEERSRAPWEPLKAFREQAAGTGGVPTLESVCRFAAALTGDQLQGLIDRADLLPPPSSSYDTVGFCRTVKEVQPILAELDRSPDLLTGLRQPLGMPVRSLPPVFQNWARQPVGDRFDGRLPLTLRLRVVEEDRPARTFRDGIVSTYRSWQFQLFQEAKPQSPLATNLLLWTGFRYSHAGSSAVAGYPAIRNGAGNGAG